MKLLKITKSGAIHFRLDDNRIGVVYENGYVRVTTKGGVRSNRFYQINKLIRVTKHGDDNWHSYKRELIPNHLDRIKRLVKFNEKNCQS
jgi:predicted transcriptional regulator